MTIAVNKFNQSAKALFGVSSDLPRIAPVAVLRSADQHVFLLSCYIWDWVFHLCPLRHLVIDWVYLHLLIIERVFYRHLRSYVLATIWFRTGFANLHFGVFLAVGVHRCTASRHVTMRSSSIASSSIFRVPSCDLHDILVRSSRHHRRSTSSSRSSLWSDVAAIQSTSPSTN